MARTRTPRITQKRRNAYRQLSAQIQAQLYAWGAIKIDEGDGTSLYAPGEHPEFALATPAGLLHVTIDDVPEGSFTVFQRFENPEAAVNVFRVIGGLLAMQDLNHFSGKWNFHWNEQRPLQADALDFWRLPLQRLMDAAPPQPFPSPPPHAHSVWLRMVRSERDMYRSLARELFIWWQDQQAMPDDKALAHILQRHPWLQPAAEKA